MLGNVEEWVADCWHNTYDSAPSTAFPGWAQDCGKHWVSRGGSFAACSGFQRVSHRSGYYPNSFWEFGVGFRCCR
jgi:formylglycine-generating enzyme required for sulfatase activity